MASRNTAPTPCPLPGGEKQFRGVAAMQLRLELLECEDESAVALAKADSSSQGLSPSRRGGESALRRNRNPADRVGRKKNVPRRGVLSGMEAARLELPKPQVQEGLGVGPRIGTGHPSLGNDYSPSTGYTLFHHPNLSTLSPTMRQLTDEGIVLNCTPHREHDLKVDLFTRTLGRITCYANGGQRSKRRFMGCLETTCHITATLDKFPSGYTLKECGLKSSQIGLRRSLRHIQSAYYMAYVCQKSLAFGQPNPELFEVLSHGLSQLCSTASLHDVLESFESHYLEAEGLYREQPGRFADLFESYTGAVLPSLHTS